MKRVARFFVNPHTQNQGIVATKDSEFLDIRRDDSGEFYALILYEEEQMEYAQYDILTVFGGQNIPEREKFRYINSFVVDGIDKHFFLKLVP